MTQVAQKDRRKRIVAAIMREFDSRIANRQISRRVALDLKYAVLEAYDTGVQMATQNFEKPFKNYVDWRKEAGQTPA